LKLLPGLTLVDGCLVANRTGSLIFSVDELFEQREPHSILAWYSLGHLTTNAVEWNACSVITGFLNGMSISVYLGEEGEIAIFDGNNFKVCNRLPQRESDGPLRGLYILDGTLWAFGTGLQLYYTKDLMSWNRLEPSEVDEAGLAFSSIESVSGFSKKEMYCAGWRGWLSIWNEEDWRGISSPTNLDLYKINCLPSGQVYSCGDEGVVIKGRNNRWIVIGNDVTSEKIWGLEEFNGRVFVSTLHFLYEIVEDNLVEVESVSDTFFPTSMYKLDSCRNVLWSIGEKQFAEFDGKKWSCLIEMY